LAGSSAEFNAAAKALIHDPSEIFGNADAPAWLTLKLLTCTDVDLKKERAVGAKADLALWATWLRLKREVTNRDNVAIDLAIALMPGGQVPSGKTVETSLWPALIDSCARSPCPCRPCSGAASCARAPRPCPCSCRPAAALLFVRTPRALAALAAALLLARAPRALAAPAAALLLVRAPLPVPVLPLQRRCFLRVRPTAASFASIPAVGALL